jgi:hypothetical protein
MSNLIPAPKKGQEIAVEADLELVDLGLSSEGVLEAAKEFGLTTFNAAKLSAFYSGGKAMKKVGVLKIGRMMLYKAGEGASTGLDQCEEALGTIQDPESRAAILPTKLGFAKELREVATAFIKSAELDGNDDSDNRGRVKPFPPGSQAGPTIAVQGQAVVTVNNNAEKPK